MRRFMLVLSAVFALAVLATPVDAQLKFGAQASLISGLEEASALDGTFGLGARALVDPPLSPVGGFVDATYYFPDNDVSYWTATAAAQLRLPLPVVRPYALVGYQIRGVDVPSAGSDTDGGFVVGAGVQMNFMMSVFLEGTFEFNEDDPMAPDFDNDPIVIKGGVMFGGG
ncbi:MAG: outer membrane beta-barrel protein [Gemmatimonadetes bacterium]|nr:outer membrane beta-barrel protein [Gemmatimonadota bacterium]